MSMLEMIKSEKFKDTLCMSYSKFKQVKSKKNLEL